MGAFKEQLADTLDRIAAVGRAHAEQDVPRRTDAWLWQRAHTFAPSAGLLPDEIDAGLMQQVREAYEQGRTAAAAEQRLTAAVQDAMTALGESFAGSYPEVQPGDYGPAETIGLQDTVRLALSLWLVANQPDEGVAPTRQDAEKIVADRRDAAIKRITPMVALVRDLELDGLSDLLHETLQADAEQRIQGYDNTVHPDWLVWTAIYERATTIHEAICVAAPADMSALLVELVGEHNAVRQLIEVARGELCDGRLPGGDLCGAPLDDGEGEDGKCGPCADRLENEREGL